MKKIIKDKLKSQKSMRGVYMPQDNWKTIDKCARKIDRSSNWFIGDIINKWIEKNTSASMR